MVLAYNVEKEKVRRTIRTRLGLLRIIARFLGQALVL